MGNGKHEYWLTVEGVRQLEAWASLGLSKFEIAEKMGIGVKTLEKYKQQYKEIREALNKGKTSADEKVENALLKRALGYEYTEVYHERVLNKETGEYEFVLTKEVTKDVKPDISAQLFWLKNRKPEVWRDKKEIEVESTFNTSSDMSDEELREKISQLKLKLGVEDD